MRHFGSYASGGEVEGLGAASGDSVPCILSPAMYSDGCGRLDDPDRVWRVIPNETELLAWARSQPRVWRWAPNELTGGWLSWIPSRGMDEYARLTLSVRLPFVGMVNWAYWTCTRHVECCESRCQTWEYVVAEHRRRMAASFESGVH